MPSFPSLQHVSLLFNQCLRWMEKYLKTRSQDLTLLCQNLPESTQTYLGIFEPLMGINIGKHYLTNDIYHLKFNYTCLLLKSPFTIIFTERRYDKNEAQSECQCDTTLHSKGLRTNIINMR